MAPRYTPILSIIRAEGLDRVKKGLEICVAWALRSRLVWCRIVVVPYGLRPFHVFRGDEEGHKVT